MPKPRLVPSDPSDLSNPFNDASDLAPIPLPFPLPRTRAELLAALHTHLAIQIAPGPPGAYLWHAFHEDHPPGIAPDAVVWANRGGGKTYLGALATTLDLLFKPGIQVRILAGSLDQAGRMHAHLRTLFAHPLLEHHVKGRITDTKLELHNTSRVELLAQSHTSVRGTRVHKLRCDEVELFNPDVWDAAQLVTRSDTLGPFRVRGTIEALSTMHRQFGLMKRIVDECAKARRSLFKWGVIDVLEHCNAHECYTHAPAPNPDPSSTDQAPCNAPRDPDAPPDPSAPRGPGPRRRGTPCPLLEECKGRAREESWQGGHLGIDDAIRMKGRVSLDVWNAEMCCTEPSRADAVLPEFDPKAHIIRELPEPLESQGEWLGGMDFGVRCAVVLWAVRDRTTNTLYIVDERVTSRARIDDHINALLNGAWPKLSWIGVDPAGNQSNEQTGISNIAAMRNATLNVRASASRIVDGVALIRTRLRSASGQVSLFIHERCHILIGALTKYHYDPRQPHNPVPVKDGSDHPIDALRYLILNLDAKYDTKSSNYMYEHH